jgi:hypothetical protein
MFKDVIKSSGMDMNGPLPKFVEQSTIIHEMAHSMGLVNNGVPMVNNHQDSSNGRHCADTDCVMYYQHGGMKDLQEYVSRFMKTMNPVMFGPECLRDVRSY